MSRIGKIPVQLPKGVTVDIKGQQVLCKGPKGQLDLTMAEGISAKVENNAVVVARANDEKFTRAMHGTTRALIKNLIIGVSEGYSRSLEIVGVGYKAVLQGQKLNLNVGFANTITIDVPKCVTVTIPDPTKVTVSGIDKEQVSRLAAAIRGARPPEPYKGKGVRYAGEVVRRKAGKAAAGAKK
jgi:large subunit ribosomal protein L6